MSVRPRQGEVVWGNPDPTRGSEQAKPRPFVIVSVDNLNRAPGRVALVVPVTRTDFSNALHLEIEPPEGGIRERSFAMPEQLRVCSHDRFSRRLGTLGPGTTAELLRRCRLLLTESF
ncbi:MAG: type II toxin-antitoxin system PemK/MazF family toxin [Solirubrobacterales bacterium]